MKPGPKDLPAQRPRDSMEAPSPADQASHRVDENGDPYEDNDLGAEWPGYMDCDDGTKDKEKRSARKRPVSAQAPNGEKA